jgi:hypothetical protein
MVVDHRDGVLENLRCAIAVLMLLKLNLMITELVEQALTKIAAAHAGRIELLDNV